MPRPQRGLEAFGIRRQKRKRKGRVPDKAERAARGDAGRGKTAMIWLVIGVLGVVLAVIGVVAPPLIVIGLIFALVGFPMALLNFRRAASG